MAVSRGRRWLWWASLVGWAAAAWGQGGIELRPPTVPADTKPELVLQLGHTGTVMSVAFSPDGRLLASGGGDRTVRLSDVATGRSLGAPLKGHTALVTSVAFSPDGRTVASASLDKTVRLWDVATGQQRGGSLTGHTDEVWSVAFAPDGRTLASGSHDGTLRLWDVATGTVRGKPVVHSGPIECVAYSADGRTLASGAGRGVRVWDVATGNLRRVVQGELDDGKVLGVAFSPDSKTLAACDAGGTLLWDTATGRQRGGKLEGFNDPVNSVSFSPDGRTLAAASEVDDGDAVVELWDVATGQRDGKLLETKAVGLRCAQFSPDGRTLAAAVGYETTQKSEVQLWDVKARQRCDLPRRGVVTELRTMALSPDGQMLAAGSYGSLRLWHMATGLPSAICLALEPYERVDALAFSPDSQTLGCLSYSPRELRGQLRLWDIATGQPRPAPLAGDDPAPVDSFAFSPDGRTLALAYREPSRPARDAADPPPSGGEVVRLWRTDTGQFGGGPFRGHTAVIDCLAFSPDGRTLAAGAGGQAAAREGVGQGGAIRLWDVATRQPRGKPLPGQAGIAKLAFAPDGHTLAAVETNWSAEGGFVGQRWEVATGQPIGTPLTGLTSLAFTPDGRALAQGQWDGTVRLCEVVTGKALGEPWGRHLDPVVDVAFTPDGRTLASCSYDGAVHLWAAATGRRLASLYTLDAGRSFLTATPEGYYDCSPEVSSAVHWRFADAYYPFDQFAGKFNRPDLIRRALAGGDLANAARLDATQLPPNLAITAPRYGTEAAGNQLAVALRAAGRHPIERVDLTINGQPLPPDVAQALTVGTPGQTVRTFQLTVPLPPGEPRLRLRAVAYDTESLKSRVEEVTVFRPGVKAGVGRLHVLAVGLNRYRKLPASAQLRYAAPDAQALTAALAKQGGGKPYTEVKTSLLLDDQATVTNLKFALRDLKDTATENDVAVIFISGHGVNGPDGTFYFPTHEVDLADLPGTALSWQDFADALREVRAKRVLVLADTCHAAGVAGAGRVADEQLARKLNRDAHRLVFAASGRDEVSLGKGEWGHGAFTLALLEALAGKADADQDGQVSFQELKDYVPDRVAALTENRQHPQLPYVDLFEPDAVLGRVP